MYEFINTPALRKVCWEYLQIILWCPQSTLIFLVALVAGFLCLASCLSQFHVLGNSGRGSFFIGLFVAAVSICGMIGSAALATLYFLPFVPDQNLRPLVMTVLLIAVFFLLIIPFSRALFRTSYATSLGSWIIALLVGLMVVFGIHYVLKPKHGETPPTPQTVQKEVEALKKKIPFLPPGGK